MNSRADLLALRRQRLIAECQLQRADIAEQLQPLAYTLDTVNTGLRIVDRVRQHPGWIAAAGLGLLTITPRRISSLLRMGTLGVRTWRTLAPQVGMLLRLSRRQ